MRRSLVVLVALLSSATIGITGSSTNPARADDLVAHEWGTFTSIAGGDGTAEEWLPLGGPPDLPCFVEHLSLDLKGGLYGTVRMETPVLYFYAPRDTRASVSVRFNQGMVTEWFPRADVTPTIVKPDDARRMPHNDFAGTITWPAVTIHAARDASFRHDGSGSHYYVARDTEASPLTIDAEREKFLFYRGVGAFQPPLAAVASDNGGAIVRSRMDAPVGTVMLFENRGGRIGYRLVDTMAREVTFGPLVLEGETAPAHRELQHALTAHGLYAQEADAMIRTWQDSWFEEGTRLFYIVPRQAVDDILPLAITPAPAALTRVFVGRIELFTPATLQTVEQALAANDQDTLIKYERFLPSIVRRLVPRANAAQRSQWARAIEQTARAVARTQPAVCR